MTDNNVIISEFPFDLNQPINGQIVAPLTLYKIAYKSEESFHEIYLIGRLLEGKPLTLYFHGSINNGLPSFYDLPSSEIGSQSLIFPQDLIKNGEYSYFLGDIDCSQFYTYPILLTAFIKWAVSKFKPAWTCIAGASMGGYSALTYSLLHEFDYSILCVPQSTLNPDALFFLPENSAKNNKSISPHNSTLKRLGLETKEKFAERLKFYPFLDIANYGVKFKSDPHMKVKLSPFFDCNSSPSKFYHLVACRCGNKQDRDYFREMIMPIQQFFVDSNIRYSMVLFPFQGHSVFIFPIDILNYIRILRKFEDENIDSNDLSSVLKIWSPVPIVSNFRDR